MLPLRIKAITIVIQKQFDFPEEQTKDQFHFSHLIAHEQQCQAFSKSNFMNSSGTLYVQCGMCLCTYTHVYVFLLLFLYFLSGSLVLINNQLYAVSYSLCLLPSKIVDFSLTLLRLEKWTFRQVLKSHESERVGFFRFHCMPCHDIKQMCWAEAEESEMVAKSTKNIAALFVESCWKIEWKLFSVLFSLSLALALYFTPIAMVL